MSLLLLVVGLILFIGLIVVHEFGHFIMARRNGVDVEEFGIFFPPRLYKRKMRGGWIFTFNAIPLGGFVKLKGEHDSDTATGSFGAASLWVKSKIMAAGVVMNLLVALALFTILALVGMPKLIPNQYTVKSDTRVVSSKVLVQYVEPGSPAAKAGLKQGDRLIKYGGPPCSETVCSSIAKTSDLTNATSAYEGLPFRVEYARGGKTQVVTAHLRGTKEVTASKNTKNPKGYLGIVPQEFILQRSTWSAPIVAAGFSAQMTALTFHGLGDALGGLGSLIAGAATGNTTARQHGQTSASSQVGGPVAIFVVLKDYSTIGLQYVIFIIAIISLTLAIMNILPIPALDGGRLWITLVARGLHKPLSARREELINMAGFMVLISLIIVITIVDVKRFF